MVVYNIITYGRFGNNVQQLVNCISIALKTGVTTVNFDFDGFHKNTIHLGQESQVHEGSCPRRIVSYFYYRNQLKTVYKKYEPSPYYERKDICMKYILPILKFRNPDRYKPYYDSALFIHIRSGDIFRGGGGHPGYIQPPLEFYIKIFNREKRRKFVFYEDDVNPVVNKLKSLFPNVTFASVSLHELIGVFINASYVVCGKGTLIPQILLFNNKLKFCYSTQNCGPLTIYAHVPNYIDVWANTEEQKRLMIKYRGTILNIPEWGRVHKKILPPKVQCDNNFTNKFIMI